MMRGFREFILRGSVVDLAVGVIIGAAFGKIVASLVADILMPPISLLLGGIDFSNRYWVLRGTVPTGTPLIEAKTLPHVITLNYGQFLNVLFEFLIIALAIFAVIRQVNKLRKTKAATKTCPECASPIPVAARRCPMCTSSLV